MIFNFARQRFLVHINIKMIQFSNTNASSEETSSLKSWMDSARCFQEAPEALKEDMYEAA